MRDHNNDSYTIHIDSFNNKGQKGDDDFETWLETEAPLKGDTTFSIVDNASMYNTSIINTKPSTVTLNSSYTITGLGHHAPSKQKKLPLDILYKWYPEAMKERNDD